MEYVELIWYHKKINAMKLYLKGVRFRDLFLFAVKINLGLKINTLLNLINCVILNEKGKVKVRHTYKRKNRKF